jgi:hypothetical protein
MVMKPPPLPHSRGKRLAQLGLWLQLAPLIGIGETMRQVWHAFQPVLEIVSQGGALSPALLAQVSRDVLQRSLTASMMGTIISFIGALLIAWAFFKFRHRPRWVLVFLLSYVILGLLTWML